MTLQEMEKAGGRRHVNTTLFFEAEAAAGCTLGTRAWKEAAKHCLLASCASASLVPLQPSPLWAVLEDASKTPSSHRSFLCKTVTHTQWEHTSISIFSLLSCLGCVTAFKTHKTQLFQRILVAWQVKN